MTDTAPVAWLKSEDWIDAALVLWLDGLGIGFTTHPDVAELGAAWSAATSTNLNDLRGGLKLDGVIERKIKFFEAKVDPSSMAFSILDLDDDIGPLMFAPQRAGIRRTTLEASADADDTTIQVADVTVIPGADTIYCELEKMAITAWDEETNTWTVERGLQSIFPASGFEWAYSHKVPATGTKPEVTDSPIAWVNRRVGLYLCHRVGGVWSAGLPGSGANDATLLWAGRIKTPTEDGQGWITLDCREISELATSTLGASMYAGELVEGAYIDESEAQMQVRIVQLDGTTNPTTYPPYIVDFDTLVGTIASHADLQGAINDKLADMLTSYDGVYGPAGLEGVLLFTDTTPDVQGESRYLWQENWPAIPLILGFAASDLRIHIFLSATCWRLLGFWGQQSTGNAIAVDFGGGVKNWLYPVELHNANDSGDPGMFRAYAGSPPMRFASENWARTPTTPTLTVNAAAGAPAFVPQTFVPDRYNPLDDTDGFLLVGQKTVLAVHQISADVFSVRGEVIELRPEAKLEKLDQRYTDAPDDGSGPVTVRQVWFEPDLIGNTMARILASTGTYGYNGALDANPPGLGVGIPLVLLDVASFLAMPAVPYLLTVTKPTPFVMLLESALNVCGMQAIWKDGKLTAALVTDDAGSAVVLDETSRVAEMKDGEKAPSVHRTVVSLNPESIINRITLKHSPALNGEWQETDTFNAEASQSKHDQTRAAVIEAYGIYREGADYWIANVASIALVYFSEPIALARRAADFRVHVTIFPGTLLEVEDGTIFDPATGERGVEALSAWAVLVSFNWMTGVGQIQFVYQPSRVVEE